MSSLIQKKNILWTGYDFLIGLSTLCFIRMTVSLPFILSNEYLIRFNEKESGSNKATLFFSQYGIMNFGLIPILVFVFLRLVLNIFDDTGGEYADLIKIFKNVWVKVLVCWGVFFTIFSTIAIVWGT